MPPMHCITLHMWVVLDTFDKSQIQPAVFDSMTRPSCVGCWHAGILPMDLVRSRGLSFLSYQPLFSFSTFHPRPRSSGVLPMIVPGVWTCFPTGYAVTISVLIFAGESGALLSEVLFLVYCCKFGYVYRPTPALTCARDTIPVKGSQGATSTVLVSVISTTYQTSHPSTRRSLVTLVRHP